MVTRIIAIPDSQGIIRVACGADTLEIVVAPHGGDGSSQAPFSAIGPRPPVPPPSEGGSIPPPRGADDGNPFDNPVAVQVIPAFDPFKKPHVFIGMEGKRFKGGFGIIDGIIGRVLAEQQNPKVPDPSNVVIGAVRSIDLHEFTKLSQRLGEMTPSVGLAVQFYTGDVSWLTNRKTLRDG